MTPVATQSLGRIRDFRLLWMSGLLAAVSAQFSAIALPLLVLRTTGSPATAGLVGTVSLATLLISMLPGGLLVDTTDRRRLLLCCDAVSCAAALVLAVAALQGSVPLMLAVVLAAAGAVTTSLYGPASLGLVRAAVPAELVGAAASRMQARSSAARLVGPLLGGGMYALHPALPFAAEAAGLALSLLCMALVRTRSRPQPPGAGETDRRRLTSGLEFVWRDRYLRTVLLVFGIGMNGAFSALMFTSLTVASDGGRSGIGAGGVVSLTACGSLAGALLAPRLEPEKRPRFMVILTCWSCTVAAAVLTIWQVPLLLGLMAAVCVGVSAVATIALLTLLVLVTPDDRLGRVQSAAGFLSSLAMPLGPLAGGALLEAWDAPTAFALLSAVFATCGLIVTFGTRTPAPGTGAPGAGATHAADPEGDAYRSPAPTAPAVRAAAAPTPDVPPPAPPAARPA